FSSMFFSDLSTA
ncbi:hypothetical protein WJ66_04430, partial [Stenotrophomonas maltophilia WJ66]